MRGLSSTGFRRRRLDVFKKSLHEIERPPQGFPLAAFPPRERALIDAQSPALSFRESPRLVRWRTNCSAKWEARESLA